MNSKFKGQYQEMNSLVIIKVWVRRILASSYTDKTDGKQCQMLLSKKFICKRDFAAGVSLSEGPSPHRFLFGVVAI